MISRHIRNLQRSFQSQHFQDRFVCFYLPMCVVIIKLEVTNIFILKWSERIMNMTQKNSAKFGFYCPPPKVSCVCIRLRSLDYALRKATFGIQWQSWAELTENICPSLPTVAMYGKDMPIPEKQWITFIIHASIEELWICKYRYTLRSLIMNQKTCKKSVTWLMPDS